MVKPARRCSPRKAEPEHGIRTGAKVFHNKFGEGQVMAVEGSGDDARAGPASPATGSSGWRWPWPS